MTKIIKNINRQFAYTSEESVNIPDRQELFVGEIVDNALISHEIGLSENLLWFYGRKYGFISHSY